MTLLIPTKEFSRRADRKGGRYNFGAGVSVDDRIDRGIQFAGGDSYILGGDVDRIRKVGSHWNGMF